MKSTRPYTQEAKRPPVATRANTVTTPTPFKNTERVSEPLPAARPVVTLPILFLMTRFRVPIRMRGITSSAAPVELGYASDVNAAASRKDQQGTPKPSPAVDPDTDWDEQSAAAIILGETMDAPPMETFWANDAEGAFEIREKMLFWE